MSMKVDMTSDEVDRQIELLKVYPEIADKYYRPVLMKDVQVLKDMILMGTPVRTGNAQKRLGSKVTGKGTSLTGEVGWYGASGQKAWYIRFPEGGTKAHEVSPGKGHTLHFVDRNGSEHFTRRSVQVKGISARGFVQSAWETAQSMVTQDLAMANEAVVQELAVP